MQTEDSRMFPAAFSPLNLFSRAKQITAIPRERTKEEQ